jgi:hypothetical protein
VVGLASQLVDVADNALAIRLFLLGVYVVAIGALGGWVAIPCDNVERVGNRDQ